MSTEICRLCLAKDSLLPIFVDTEQSAAYSSILLLTTGLKIEVNDGLPQTICTTCTDAVNSALTLRTTGRCSERELLSRGHDRGTAPQHGAGDYGYYQDETICDVNIFPSLDDDEGGDGANNASGESVEDRDDDVELPKLEVEVEFDRLTENGGKTKCAPDTKKMSRKQKRQMYLQLVDGPLRPGGPVRCRECGRTVSKWRCFISHAKLHLGFNFVCEYCGMSFISSTQLKRHCRSFHGMPRELACPHCSYLALDNAQLKLHVRRVHSGERPFACAHCSAAFPARRALLQHLDTHRDTLTAQCGQCSRSFKSGRQLSRHRYSAHSLARRTPRDATRV